MKKVEELNFKVDVDLRYILDRGGKEVEKYINNKFACSIAEFIVKNLEELPIEIKKEYMEYIAKQEITMKMFIISKDELRRLKLCEKELMERYGRYVTYFE